MSNPRRNRSELIRALVVDDEADIRELLDMTLARMGLAADSAATVAEAKFLGDRFPANDDRVTII